MTVDFDVIIVGGGPGGSTTASYLAKAGLSVAVFESEIFPRPHVGESLVPATTRVLLETGAMAEIEAAGFPKKYGASWTTPDTYRKVHAAPLALDFDGLDFDGHAEVAFGERAQEGVDRIFTYHVDRGKFDLILLKNAESLGAQVFQNVRVQKVDFDDPDKVTVTVGMGPRTLDFTARVVVDASGRSTFLGRQQKIKVADPHFNQYAIHTWFEGLDRKALAKSPKEIDNIHVHFLPISDTWVWQIPITDTITSIGVVTQKKNFGKLNADREEFFWEFVGSRPDLAEELKKCERVRPFKAEGDYSYSMNQVSGDRFVMVGDAARFVDPIFSSGVGIAMNTARLACEDIVAAFKADRYDAAQFAEYARLQKIGTRNWYEFISIYYRLNLLFGVFVQHPRFRLDVLQLLQGDMYDERPRALTAMRAVINEVESDPKHVWHPFLGTIRASEPSITTG
ncbi:tryptophan 7-halogenase [Streptomyces sp. NBC_00193]|uniref:NAD(P)/FAD-dependent oxidoreductase n=1 Tax=Streptomyces sp. NBC_00193 TaxID=2975675 RepID=UPI00225830D9|nr:NAD(P)/FAD-dependent oxidoreductase [Streptomyces sp. NBC_00193]MCX5301617.1 tryptophan 7-halogenase [Streptomyces sp. NBC_00193]